MNISKILSKIYDFYKNLSITRKMQYILYAQIIIPLFFIGFVSYNKSAEILERKSLNYSLDILYMLKLRLNDFVDSVEVISQDLLYDKEIHSIFANKKDTDILDDYEREGKAKNILKKVVFSRSEIESIGLLRNDDKIIYFDDSSKKDYLPKVINSIHNMKQAARQKSGKLTWYYDVKDGVVTNIFALRQVNDVETFNELGMLVIKIDKNYFNKIFEDLKFDNMKNIAMFNDNNELITQMGVLPSASIENLKQSNLDLTKEVGYITNKTKDYLFTYLKRDDPGLLILTGVRLKDLYSEIDILRNSLIALCIITALLVSFLGILMSVDLIKPINQLIKAMKELKYGNSKVSIEINRKDEIGFLQSSFNNMSNEINNLLNSIYREQLTRKEAEIRALQSQINPHFLFNTLEAVNWMAQLNNVPEISKMVSNLASILEASIGKGEKNVTISQELSYVDKYISIINMRFDNKIEFTKSVEEGLENIKIPKLLFQPIIENAVFHGVDSKKEGAKIDLSIKKIENDIIIKVFDNGIGMKKEETELINELLKVTNDEYFKGTTAKKRNGIGIENVNRRIKLLYGDDYGLSIESVYGEYTKVIVRIPYNEAKNFPPL